MAPQIEYSDREERLEFIQDRYHCKAPSCGRCGSCALPDGVPAVEYFADYIWKGGVCKASGKGLGLLISLMVVV